MSKSLSELGVGHAYAPGAEPSVFETIVRGMMSLQVDLLVLGWVLLFFIIVLAMLRVAAIVWLIAGRLVPAQMAVEETGTTWAISIPRRRRKRRAERRGREERED